MTEQFQSQNRTVLIKDIFIYKGGTDFFIHSFIGPFIDMDQHKNNCTLFNAKTYVGIFPNFLFLLKVAISNDHLLLLLILSSKSS